MAVVQAFGDAVLDEAPGMIVSNYACTIFLVRSIDVHDKRLWVSPPVWWNDTEVPARACWLSFLNEMEQRIPWKRLLSRTQVPATGKGYSMQLQAASETDAAASVSVVLQAQHPSGKG